MAHWLTTAVGSPIDIGPSIHAGIVPALVTTPVALLTPPSFAGLVGWWKANSYVPQTDGTQVGATGLEWVEQVNGVLNGTNTGATRPYYRTNIFGSEPALEFRFQNGFVQQNYLVLAASQLTGLVLPANFTIIAIVKGPSSGVGTSGFGGSVVGDAYGSDTTSINALGNSLGKPGTFSENMCIFSSGNPNYSVAITNSQAPAMMSFIRTGNNMEFRKNNATIDTVAIIGTLSSCILNFIGAANAVYVRSRFDGYIGEICVYNNALTAANMNQLYDDYFLPKFTIIHD